MRFISYFLSLSLYITSSYLKCYSVLMNLILQMHVGQRSMCGVIAVDAGRSQSTCLGHGAYIHNHCLEYCHNYVLFYQLPNSNLFTHCMLFSREKPLVKSMAPGSIFYHIVFRSIIPKTQKKLPSLFIYLCYFVFLLDLFIQSDTILPISILRRD